MACSAFRLFIFCLRSKHMFASDFRCFFLKAFGKDDGDDQDDEHDEALLYSAVVLCLASQFARLRRGDFRYTTILYQSTLSKLLIQATYPHTLSKHFIQARYQSMLPTQFIQALYQST